MRARTSACGHHSCVREELLLRKLPFLSANSTVLAFRAQGLDLSLPVALLHVAAFSMGYFICKGLNFNEKTCRTVSIETGTDLS